MTEFHVGWRRTWGDRAPDYFARQDDVYVGRIYGDREPRTMKVRWRWVMTGMQGNREGTSGGHVASAREAARAVEAAWARFRGVETSSVDCNLDD